MSLLPEEIPEHFPPTRKYLAGVSGGRDSTSMLCLLHEAGYRKIVVCHLNHRIRAWSAKRDAAFVHDLASELAYTCIVGTADVPSIARAEHISIETAGRLARHRFFEQTSRDQRSRVVFLGHQANDQAETVLMNLFRGAATPGLGAMRVTSTIGPLTLVRPLLGVWREELSAYLQERGIQPRDDPMNKSPDFLRNRIRHELIPLANSIFARDIEPLLCRTADILATEDLWLEEQAAQWGPLTAELSVSALRQTPVALQRRLLLLWLRNTHGLSDIGFQQIEAVRALLDPDAATAKVNLPAARHARRRAGKLFVE